MRVSLLVSAGFAVVGLTWATSSFGQAPSKKSDNQTPDAQKSDIQSPGPQEAWKPEAKKALLQNLNEEISSFESGANGNDFWLKVFAVSAVLLNLFAAAAAAAVNRETAQFVQAVKPWLLWGAAFASLCAGACTTIPAVTDMNKRRAAYTQELYALKVLKAEIQVETVSPQVATTRLKEILSMQPFKVQ